MLLLLLLLVPVMARRNILFLVADDMRPNLGSYSEANLPLVSAPHMHTPHLDTLAASSVQFNKAFVQFPLCAPSRASVLTSRRPDTTHVLDLASYWRETGGNFTSIPQYFAGLGYNTAGAGKVFQFDHQDKELSFPQGYHSQQSKWNTWAEASWRALSPADLAEAPLQDTANANWALDKLEQFAPAALVGEQPFFLAYGVHKPHRPYLFPERFLQHYPEEAGELPYNPYIPVDMPDNAWFNFAAMRRYPDLTNEEMGIPDLGQPNVTFPDWKVVEERRAYYSSLSYADQQLGRLLTRLQELGLDSTTIVVFWGDHGYQLGEHTEWMKTTNFQIANWVPLLVRLPGQQAAVSEELVELVDLFPTLVEAAGLPQLPTCPEDSSEVLVCTEGTSLVGLMEGTEGGKDAAFWQYRGDGHYGGNPTILPDVMGYTVRTQQYSYTEWVHIQVVDEGSMDYRPDWEHLDDEGGCCMLYLLEEDPQENINRAFDPAYAGVREEASTRLRAGWRAAL